MEPSPRTPDKDTLRDMESVEEAEGMKSEDEKKGPRRATTAFKEGFSSKLKNP